MEVIEILTQIIRTASQHWVQWGTEAQVKVLTEDPEVFQRKLDETTKLVREHQPSSQHHLSPCMILGETHFAEEMTNNLKELYCNSRGFYRHTRGLACMKLCAVRVPKSSLASVAWPLLPWDTTWSSLPQDTPRTPQLLHKAPPTPQLLCEACCCPRKLATGCSMIFHTPAAPWLLC